MKSFEVEIVERDEHDFANEARHQLSNIIQLLKWVWQVVILMDRTVIAALKMNFNSFDCSISYHFPHISGGRTIRLST